MLKRLFFSLRSFIRPPLVPLLSDLKAALKKDPLLNFAFLPHLYPGAEYGPFLETITKISFPLSYRS